MTLLQVKSLSQTFGGTGGVRDIDLTVAEGSRTAIVGPSGSGKTTLLRLIAGFEPAESGRISFQGQVITEGVAPAIPAYRRGIGIVAQDGALFPHLTVAENIGFGLPKSDGQRMVQIHQLAQTVGLDAALLARRPHEVSGGQQQRIALARALALKPRLMLFDEPFASLDTGLRAAMRQAVIQVLGRSGIAAILVTHDQAEALSFADQVAVMANGRMVEIGSPQSLYFHPHSRLVAEFLGEAVILPATIRQGFALCAVGTIPVTAIEDGTDKQILLRPEQLSVGPDTGAGGCLARVVATEFAGGLSSVTLELRPQGQTANVPPPLMITLKRSFSYLPAIGEVMVVSVHGAAHVLKT